MATLTTADSLVNALVRFEEQLETPHVPGELNGWGEEVSKLLTEVDMHLRTWIDRENPSSFKHILKNDIELAKRVEKMQAEDKQLLITLENVAKQAEELNRIVEEGKTAEDQFLPKRNRLVDDGLQFILSIRKQKSAVDTWIGESLRRDTGAGD